MITPDNNNPKVTTEHLKRKAYLYVRQSTIRQVFEHAESAQRQYALRQRALALGWQQENIEVIDCDQGQSGASMADRLGFQKLVAEIGLNKAGIVMGLEVSRLARNNTDWHRLLEMCALTHTLILDEEGLYDPGHFNDRLLLGLKGTMSEAELHMIKARLQGGILNKARRGELKVPLPIGFVYDQDGKVLLDPDEQIRKSLQEFFKTFMQEGSASAAVKHMRRQGILFPRRFQAGSGKVRWEPITHANARAILHNPRYAGAYAFGRTRSYPSIDGIKYATQKQENWQVLIKDAHPGYITWEQYQQHECILKENAQALGRQRAWPAREGPALLQGLVICGKCGRKITLRYHNRNGKMVPDYTCLKERIEKAAKPCQVVPGGGVDTSLATLLIETITPLAMEVVIEVEEELKNEYARHEKLRTQQLQRLQYEADKAKERYLCVDPKNRLVADNLESDWNEKLRKYNETYEQYESIRKEETTTLSEQQKQQIRSLTTDFPKLWHSEQTSDKERKRIARLLLEDVTLTRLENRAIQMEVRFKGGLVKSLQAPVPLTAWELRKTKPEIIEEVDRLLDDYTDTEIATDLNKRGWSTSSNNSFTPRTIKIIRYTYQIKSRYERLRQKGYLRAMEMAKLLGMTTGTVRAWRLRGKLKGVRFNDKEEYLYQRPSKATITYIKGQTARYKPNNYNQPTQ